MMSLTEIARALGGEVSAGQVLAPGPGHKPSDRSLSVKPSATAPDGLLVYSFADDDQRACLDYVRDRLGLPAWQPNGRGSRGNGKGRPSDADIINMLAKPAGKPADAASTGRSTVTATYDYTDAAGALLYQVQRLNPKAFRQRRPDGNGGWLWNAGDSRVLYRLPDLLAFPAGTIFIVEGEKDADRLISLGCCATTISGGSKWTPEIVDPIKGRDVVILPDNDDAGRTKAQAAATALQGLAATIRIVALPGLADHGDVSDWLDAGHSKEQLEEICLAAPLAEISVQDQAKEVLEDKAADPDLGEWDAGDDLAPISPRAWLLGNSFCRSFISSVIAEGGTGKSALRLAQLLSSASGRALTGEHVFTRCRVLIVSLEDNADELRRRLRAACLHHKVDQTELKGWLFLAAPGAAGGKIMALDPHGRPIIGALAGKIERTIERRQIDIVSLDPFVKSHSIEENSNSAIDDVVGVLAELAERFNVAVDIPHHASKGPADPGNANRGRGASAMKDAGRLIYTLSPMSPEEGQAFGLSEIERRRLIRLDSAKVNIAPPMSEAKWFRLVGVEIGNATDLYPSGDTVQTVEPWTPPDSFAGLSSVTLNQILTDIEAGTPDGNRYTDAPNAIERAAWRVIERQCPSKSEAACRQIIRAWLKSGLLIRRTYENKATRKPVLGLWIDPEKRPG